MEKLSKSFGTREKKERKTIKDGSKVIESICEAVKDGKSAYGFTMGNVSLIQIVEAVTKEFGGGFELGTCIWSINQVDVERLHTLKTSGLISECKFLIDPSAYTRKYEAIEHLYLRFGEGSVRTVPTHAKFVTLKSETMSICITSSMNFTHNPRIEQYEVVECSETVELMQSVINDSFNKYASEDNFTGQSLSKFNKIRKTVEQKKDMPSTFDFSLGNGSKFDFD